MYGVFQAKNKKTLFVQLILDNIWTVYDAVLVSRYFPHFLINITLSFLWNFVTFFKVQSSQVAFNKPVSVTLVELRTEMVQAEQWWLALVLQGRYKW